MKKVLFVLLLVAVLIGSFVSCKEEPAHEHTWDEGSITTPATCEAAGVKTYKCECGETKTESIPALGHNWDAGVVSTPATCGAAGVKTFTCQNNPVHTKTESIPATGLHTWGEWEETTPATETTTGVKTATCSVCGQKKTEDIPALSIFVSTFAEFEQAFTDIKAEGETRKIIYLTADIAWDQEKYPGSTSNGLQSANAFIVEADGLTIDLGTHSITGMVPQGLNIKGSNITIKNGSFLRDDTKFTDLTNNRYGLCVDYSTSNKAAEQAYEQNITLKDITTDAGVNLGYVKNVLIENFTVSSDTYRPLCLCGTQDVVIKNSSITKIVGGTTSDAALLVTQSGSATMEGTVSITNNVTGAAVYALSISGGAAATGASVTIAEGASVTIRTVADTVKADPVYMTYGTSLIVDGTLNLSAGANTSGTYTKGSGVFYFTGKDSDSAGRSSVTVNGTLNITLPGEQDVIAFGNNDTGYYVVKFAQGSTLTLNGNPISTITTAHCAPATKVTVIDSEEGSRGNRLTFIDLR